MVPSLWGVLDFQPPQDVEEFKVSTRDGAAVTVWGTKSAGGAVALILHGNADLLPTVSHSMRFLAARGIRSFAFDYRGLGETPGWPSEQRLYMDAEAALENVAARTHVNPSDVVVIGYSIGTGPAAYLAQRYNTKKLFLFAPYYSLRDLVSARPVVGWLSPLLKYEFPTGRYLAATKGTEITLFHGLDDEVIPPAHSERIVSELAPGTPRELLLVPGQNHNTIFGYGSLILVKKVLSAAAGLHGYQDSIGN
jgi:fermentation-respiration switch protein FrsA (DUF1100 family)